MGVGGRLSRESKGPAEGRGRAGGSEEVKGVLEAGGWSVLRGEGEEVLGGSRRFRGRLEAAGSAGLQRRKPGLSQSGTGNCFFMR